MRLEKIAAVLGVYVLARIHGREERGEANVTAHHNEIQLLFEERILEKRIPS